MCIYIANKIASKSDLWKDVFDFWNRTKNKSNSQSKALKLNLRISCKTDWEKIFRIGLKTWHWRMHLLYLSSLKKSWEQNNTFHKNLLNCNLISTKKLKVGICLKSKLNRDKTVYSTFESSQTSAFPRSDINMQFVDTKTVIEQSLRILGKLKVIDP